MFTSMNTDIVNSKKTGHGRKRCPEPVPDEADGDFGNSNGEMNGGDGWETGNQADSSGPSTWEQDSIPAPSAPPLATGNGW